MSLLEYGQPTRSRYGVEQLLIGQGIRPHLAWKVDRARKEANARAHNDFVDLVDVGTTSNGEIGELAGREVADTD